MKPIFDREKQVVFYLGISFGLGLSFILGILFLLAGHFQIVPFEGGK
jgi:hypothetical protein